MICLYGINKLRVIYKYSYSTPKKNLSGDKIKCELL